MINLIKIQKAEELKGADRFVGCSNCISINNAYKITFYDEKTNQQQSLRVCKKCMMKLAILMNEELLKEVD